MERADRAPLSTFYAPGAWGPVVDLDEDAAHHARVKRLAVGDRVRLSSGDGRRVSALITELGKRTLAVSTVGEDVEQVSPPVPVELWAPVGDRERMLWLAEKATELGLAVWRPLVYRRSRSVSPRGEGEAFRARVRARMISALEQSGGAWLPEQLVETALEDALGTARHGTTILLDAAGESLSRTLVTLTSHDSQLGSQASPFAPRARDLTIALGPEGGLDEEERGVFVAAHWRLASLGPNVLRFETAALAALAIVRSHHW